MQRLLITFFVSCFFLCKILSQQGVIVNNGSKSLSLGGISSTLDNADAILNNFSGITSSSNLMVIASSERRFELEELTSATFGVSLPVAKIGYLGLVVSTYGFEEYTERKMSFGYARKLSQYISISANFDFNTVSINQFGTKQFISFGLGISGRFSNDFRYGVYIFNPEKIEIAESNEVPGFIKVGINKEFSKTLSLYSEVHKPIDEDINFLLGVDYQLIDDFSVRVGYNTNPGGFGFGLSYSGVPQLVLEGGTQYNSILGLTPGFTFKYMPRSSS